MTQSAKVRFMHKKGSGQSYVMGEQVLPRGGKVNKTIQFTNYEFVTDDPEQIAFLRAHPENQCNGGAFLYEVSAADEMDLESIRELKEGMDKRRSKAPAETVVLQKKPEEGAASTETVSVVKAHKTTKPGVVVR